MFADFVVAVEHDQLGQGVLNETRLRHDRLQPLITQQPLLRFLGARSFFKNLLLVAVISVGDRFLLTFNDRLPDAGTCVVARLVCLVADAFADYVIDEQVQAVVVGTSGLRITVLKAFKILNQLSRSFSGSVDLAIKKALGLNKRMIKRKELNSTKGC